MVGNGPHSLHGMGSVGLEDLGLAQLALPRIFCFCRYPAVFGRTKCMYRVAVGSVGTFNVLRLRMGCR